MQVGVMCCSQREKVQSMRGHLYHRAPNSVSVTDNLHDESVWISFRRNPTPSGYPPLLHKNDFPDAAIAPHDHI